MSQTSNNFLVSGLMPAGDGQWQPPFQLVDDTGAVMFAVAFDGTLTTTSNQIVANPGNFKATGTGEIDGNFSIGAAFGGSPTFKITASSGATVASGSITAAGFVSTGAASKLDLSATTGGNAAIKYTETTDTPTVAFTDNGAASHAPTTAPHGYLKVLVGSTPYYIPAWA